MFHLIHGYITTHAESTYIDNSIFGIEVTYTGSEYEGMFFLYPQIDQNQGTIKYYAFDMIGQKERFLKLLKIQGVGGKSAYQIAMLPPQEVAQAIEGFDMKYFQQISGIGPKTAKRLLVELKNSFSEEDVQKLTVDERLYKDIIGALQGLGYTVSDIKKQLTHIPYPLEKENLPDIMKRMIDHL